MPAMDVIGAGFGRTGTLSLKTALEQLGFGPCFHMFELMEGQQHLDLWAAATRGERVDWRVVFDGWRSTVDWPGCSYYEQIMEDFPEAKVLLNVREPDAWYTSMTNTIYRASEDLRAALAGDGELPAWMSREVAQIILDLVWDGQFDGRFADRDHAIAEFHRHNAEVQERVPADRLLVYEVSQGWQPLCAFLGVDVPDEPFPRLNDSAAMQQMLDGGEHAHRPSPSARR
jgi:hypothetical protein